MANVKKIAFLGECMVELRGQPFDAVNVSFGGDTLNSALYCARASGDQLDTFYVTALGTDGFSNAMLNAWGKEKIDTSLVVQFDEHQPGMYAVILDSQGERSFCYWRSESAARYLFQHADFSRVEDTLKSFSCLVLSGISLAIIHDRKRLVDLLSALKNSGVTTIFDTNYRPTLWKDAFDAQTWCRQALANCKIALVTFDDEQALWGDDSPETTCARLHELGVETVVVKLGEDGAYYSQRSSGETKTRTGLVAARKVTTVCDTTAAGDAFNAGFLSAYELGKSIEEACTQGHQIASTVIQYPGAIIPEDVNLLR